MPNFDDYELNAIDCIILKPIGIVALPDPWC